MPLGYYAYALALPLLLMVIMNLMIRPWRIVLAVAALPLVLASCAVAARSGKVITESRPASSFTAAELTGRLAYRIAFEARTAGGCRRRRSTRTAGRSSPPPNAIPFNRRKYREAFGPVYTA